MPEVMGGESADDNLWVCKSPMIRFQSESSQVIDIPQYHVVERKPKQSLDFLWIHSRQQIYREATNSAVVNLIYIDTNPSAYSDILAHARSSVFTADPEGNT
jgi:hypothetical protein